MADKTHNLIAVANYRARKLGLPADLTFDQWQVILEARPFCSYCGGVLADSQLEHRIPLSDPASPGTTSTNVFPSCRNCNLKKRTETWTTDHVQLSFTFTSS